MKKKSLYCRVSLFLLVIVLSPLVSLYGINPKQLSRKEKKWFDEQKWLQGGVSLPDAGIDAVTFSHHYAKFPERWDKVFKFIKDNDLATLSLGKQSLGEDVTVSVEEYMTREPGKEYLEGHRKKIDLQYIVNGCELQGYAKLATVIETVNPYDEKKDVGYYKVPVITFHSIRPNQFTIFFPDDIHITNIQYGEKNKVRKVVFKVSVD